MTTESKVKATAKTTFGGTSIFGFIIALVLVICSYFVYHQHPSLTLAFILLLAIFWLGSMLAIIPFVGVIVQGLFYYYWAVPFVYSLTGLYGTWVVNIAFWLYIVIGVIVTAAVTLVVLKAIFS